MPIHRESHHERRAKALAQTQGWHAIKVYKLGWPDRLFVKGGRCFFVEFKAPGKKPSPQQAWRIDLLRSEGCSVYVIDNWQDMAIVLEQQAGDTP